MQAAAAQIQVRFELIDANGLLPLRATDRVFLRAFDFRRYLQKHLVPHLHEFPLEDPLTGTRLPKLDGLPDDIEKRWPAADLRAYTGGVASLHALPIDHRVGPAPLAGGSVAGAKCLQTFIRQKLSRYNEDRNQPEENGTSGLSPYLHFGHVSVHEVFARVMERAGWAPDKISDTTNGSASGWWGTDPNVESFLDELMTWRELGYNMCSHRDDYDRYDSLPEWARDTLAEHAGDRREHVYSLEEFEQAATHDPLWNASQRQLVREGRIHNYMRMLWGKKILEWTSKPQDALEVMLELNNKYALDGRDPNSYSGIFWVLGRYDRPWGPERDIFGKIRYMSSENTARKLRVGEYLRRFGDEPESGTSRG
jgi:deoxyribodipyrimidine photo-lyase